MCECLKSECGTFVWVNFIWLQEMAVDGRRFCSLFKLESIIIVRNSSFICQLDVEAFQCTYLLYFGNSIQFWKQM